MAQQPHDDCGHEAESDFGIAELGGFGGEDDIAGGGQATASAEGAATDGCHNRMGMIANRGIESAERAGGVEMFESGGVGCLLERGYIHAGAEIGTGGGDERDPDGIVRCGGGERRVELTDQLIVNCVALFRAVER